MECGSCTVCCRLPVLPDLDKAAGDMCDFCSGVGCNIYESRPQSCREFRCAYHQGSKVNLALRPDKCGILFEKLADDIIFGLLDPEKENYPHLNGQITSFLNEGINVVIMDNNQPRVYHLNDVDPGSILTRVVKSAEAA